MKLKKNEQNKTAEKFNFIKTKLEVIENFAKDYLEEKGDLWG